MQETQFQQLPQTQMAAAAVVMGQIVLRVGTWDTASIQIIEIRPPICGEKLGLGIRSRSSARAASHHLSGPLFNLRSLTRPKNQEKLR
jgi:hypothetical protein